MTLERAVAIFGIIGAILTITLFIRRGGTF